MKDNAIFQDSSHGNRGGGSLHTLATRDVAGFMPTADKTGIDQLLGAPVTQTASFTVQITDGWFICSAASAIVVTLPSPSDITGRVLEFKTTTAFAVTSATSNVVPITGGAATTAILPATAGAWVTLKSDGTSWIIMRKG